MFGGGGGKVFRGQEYGQLTILHCLAIATRWVSTPQSLAHAPSTAGWSAG